MFGERMRLSDVSTNVPTRLAFSKVLWFYSSKPVLDIYVKHVLYVRGLGLYAICGSGTIVELTQIYAISIKVRATFVLDVRDIYLSAAKLLNFTVSCV